MNLQAVIQEETSSRSIKISEAERKLLCSRMELTNTNFGDFYVAHRTFIDSLIAIWSFDYSNRYDVEDIRQEVLYRLQINNVLDQYDPSRGQLNTFLTFKIVNYIRHAIRSLPCMDNFIQVGKDCSSFAREEFDECKHSQYKSDTFETVSVNEKLSKLRDKFGPEMVDFINELQEGLNLSEIAEKKKLTKYCVASQYMKALKSEAVRRLLNE